MSEKFRNFINGEWLDSSGGETFENRNPADNSDLIGIFPSSNKQDVDDAVKSARVAFEKWRLIPAPKRGDVLKVVGDKMLERKDEISFEMTREMGKVFAETKGDTQEGIDTAYYAASEGRRLFGYNAPSELPNKMNLSFRVPIGVAGLITPFNFPMAIPTWKMFPALVCGNTVIIKPAELVPKTATTLVEIVDEAMKEVLGKDYIPGVVNLVQGTGEIVGEAMISHDGIDLISFTGSSEVGSHINSVAGKMLKRVSLEMGGKNAQIVMPDANMELALDAVLWGAFGTTGQRCTATSRLILHESIHDSFVLKLKERAQALRLGYGNDDNVDVGPVISQESLDKIQKYVSIGQEEDKAELIIGGKHPGGDLSKGFFFEPTIFVNVTRDMRIAREEIFGPVLSVIKCKSLDEAISILNDTKYGLSSSIFTNDVNDAFRAVRDIKAGITYINGATIGAEAHMPFGGVKATGNGHREGGWTVYDFYSEWKAVYVDYSGKLQRAQIDNY
ncbi:MAG: aldehyde dehydrogenase family protein [Ignavibacteriaceae bacterium]|mgnify:CR=1 FL=1|jgi:NAD-dependent aldehyde dehydrogenases|nr:MAG: aldehyde dehydrogenase family protein [Chlorobiota bacterium]KXK04957.1 MAG: NAD-dependent aldehyde dehydrogenase [Chlorobi bacterium OLB4]MBV6397772.1 Aldehyde dehydrogenase, thermostable [Ignavibacteria bacterium]MCC6885549.1 aldehyde dehydrogenase family protein [Ignavibacteriales bacterium]MCE7952903.1 aldehyde dehydrogenase family protein [Chlorobi bacterium CHB7]MDL1886933.1 aldehyde dehydrogenase family protein [Ignavibacteria bacterium CHB1]MEB2328703.1 aldehyde dehydrogenase 